MVLLPLWSLLAKSPRDSNWAAKLIGILDRFRYRVNDDVLRLIQGEVDNIDRDTEIRLRYVLGRVFSARGEAGLGLEAVEKGLALVRPDELVYVLAFYHAKANLQYLAGDTGCPDTCRLAIQAARAQADYHVAAQVFRIWSMFHWTRHEFDLAMPLFDEATENLRKVGGAQYAFHLLDTLERVTGLDRERMRRYCKDIIDVIANERLLDEIQTAKARLSVAQHLMAATPTPVERELVLEQTVKALATFRRFAGLEGRAAACAALLSIAHLHSRNFGLAQTYSTDHNLWLPAIFGDTEALRSELFQCLLSDDVNRLFEYEITISVHKDAELYAVWASVVAIVLLRRKEFYRALDLLREAECQLCTRLCGHRHSDLALIYQIRAEAYQALNQEKPQLDALVELVRLLPADLYAASKLCVVALRNGSYELAAREAAKLIEARPMLNVYYRIAARAYAQLGDYNKAAKYLDQAFALFPENTTIVA